jgi:hypothetical protein
MGKEVQKVGPLTVRGFKQVTLDDWSKPVNEGGYGPTKTGEQMGFLGLDPEDRRTLGVVEGEIIQAVRSDINDVVPINVRITPGRKGYAAITGVAREKFGKLTNEKKETEPKREGDKINIIRDGDILKISLAVEEKTNEVMETAKGDKKKEKIIATLADYENATSEQLIKAFNASLKIDDSDLKHKAFLALALRQGKEILMALVKAVCSGSLSNIEIDTIKHFFEKQAIKDCLISLSGKKYRGAKKILDNYDGTF